MKTLLAFSAAALLLGGCVAVPVDPGPVYAAPPPPVVVVRPAYGYHYRGGPYWHRGWH